MARGDLHSALKTEVVAAASEGGVQYQLVRLQSSKEDIAYTLHATPTSFSSAGLQTTDLLGYLGFELGACAFSQGRKCYAARVSHDFLLPDFAKAFVAAYEALGEAERELEACGFPLDQPEGWGFFQGGGSLGKSYSDRFRASGDAHTSPQSKLVKQSDDNHFLFTMSWVEGDGDKGWTFHYRPKHPPLSAELRAAFSFVKLRQFNECPYFEFESCYWRFFPYERSDSFFDSKAEYVHRSFDNHNQKFALGIESLLGVHSVLHPFGFDLLSIPTQEPSILPWSQVPRGQALRVEASLEERFDFDVALSFAGLPHTGSGLLRKGGTPSPNAITARRRFIHTLSRREPMYLKHGIFRVLTKGSTLHCQPDKKLHATKCCLTSRCSRPLGGALLLSTRPIKLKRKRGGGWRSVVKAPPLRIIGASDPPR